ncbi:MAG: oligosaccharide flippase family protein [Candidatus Devosia euplotis]|nr:oligosaccharide flippase family protein [Candidatus Devosia euplotis]
MLHTSLWRSVGSLAIKIVTAGLTYFIYVMLSRTMTVDEYGHFAFGMALATVLAIAAGVGQPTAILRLWSQETVAGHKAAAIAVVQAGSVLTILACLAIALPATVIAPFSAGIVLSEPDALILSAALLSGTLAVQFWTTMRRRYVLSPVAGVTRPYWQRWGGISRWLLLGALIETAALNADVILVGLMLNLESSDLYFNAFRTAELMTLFTFAIELVIALVIAQHFHAGKMRKAQAITAMGSAAGFAFSLLVFAVFFGWGDWVLSFLALPMPKAGWCWCCSRWACCLTRPPGRPRSS